MAKAVQRGDNWFGYYWAPTAPIGKFNMQLVPFGVPLLVQRTGMVVLQKQNKTVLILSHQLGLSQKSHYCDYKLQRACRADAMGYFAKRIFPGPIMNKMLVYMEDNQANGPDAAVEFLIEYEDVWTPWVSADVAKKVKASL